MEGFEVLFMLLVCAIVVAIGIAIIRIPIMIAKSRGVSGNNLTTISLLSWLGVFLGLTWVIALILALVFHPQTWIQQSSPMTATNVDALMKLNELREKGVITEEEFNRQKVLLLKT